MTTIHTELAEPATVVPAKLHVVGGRPQIDLPAAERAISDLLVALGRDPHGTHLADTPRRVASAYAEMLTPRAFDLTTFPNDEGYDELVLARGIPVQSLCEHHMLPFQGVAHVTRTPTSVRRVPTSPPHCVSRSRRRRPTGTSTARRRLRASRPRLPQSGTAW